jgi:hypothetical protein
MTISQNVNTGLDNLEIWNKILIEEEQEKSRAPLWSSSTSNCRTSQ